MKTYSLSIPFLIFLLIICCSFETGDTWISREYKGFKMHCTAADSPNMTQYSKLIFNGMEAVNEFFGEPCKKDFNVYIHPDRRSLDSTWQHDWDMPGFKSECWMVASGVGDRLDVISPKSWDVQACEHIYADSARTQQLLTHELVHVYHGQLNISPDFSDVTGIDWFVEGLAVYASGQCDQARIAAVKSAISENSVPPGLGDFWTGKLKYGLSGTVVMYIDMNYGRAKLKELLKFNHIDDLLLTLDTTEEEILRGWKKYIMEL